MSIFDTHSTIFFLKAFNKNLNTDENISTDFDHLKQMDILAKLLRIVSLKITFISPLEQLTLIYFDFNHTNKVKSHDSILKFSTFCNFFKTLIHFFNNWNKVNASILFIAQPKASFLHRAIILTVFILRQIYILFLNNNDTD